MHCYAPGFDAIVIVGVFFLVRHKFHKLLMVHAYCHIAVHVV